MYYWLAIVVSAIGFALWIWYELKNARTLDEDGNLVPRSKRTEFDTEHDEAVKLRETPQ